MNSPQVNIYLQPSGTNLYYTASPDDNGRYIVITNISAIPIKTLPKGWMDLQVKWDRDNTFMGVFTTQAQNLKFVNDARAILLNLYYAANGGIQAACIMTIDIFIDVFTGYKTTYQCEIDFSKAIDQKHNSNTGGLGLAPNNGEFAVPTLNGKLNELLAAYGDTQYNIPMWTTPDNGATWFTDAKFVMHTGIKLRYNSQWTSSATPDNPLEYYGTKGTQLNGWNQGRGYNGGDGYHIIPAMARYDVTQNNGATTWIGNDILTPFLLQGNQTPGAANFGSENAFEFVNHSQPFSKNNYVLKNLLPSADIDMSVSISATFRPVAPGLTLPNVFISYGGGSDYHLYFCLFEIGAEDRPAVVAGRYVDPVIIYDYPLPAGPQSTNIYIGTLDNTANPVPIKLKYGKTYVLGMICDLVGFGVGSDMEVGFLLDNLTLSIASDYNSGTGAPVDAPIFPQSPIMGYTANQLLQKLVPCLSSTETDPYGFPVLPAIPPYAGVSTFLSTDAEVLDNSPTNTLLFSSNCLQLVSGYPYITMSMNDLFKFCFNTWGCGLGIRNFGGMNITPDAIQIEKLEKFFENNEMLDLGDNVASMRIEPMTDFMACFLNTGYSGQDTNNDFGADIFCREFDFNTPLSKVAGTTLSIINSIVADMYAMEKRRAQQVTTAMPIAGNGQSNSNETFVLEFDPSTLSFDAVNPPYPNGNNSNVTVFPPVVKKYPPAQSNNDTLGNYIYGLFYPDTALNLGLTPVKNMLRLGAYLRSMLDNQDSKSLMFRKIYQMLYNSVADLIPGIVTGNLDLSGNPVIKECADIAITDLKSYVAGYGNQLFRPYKIHLTTVSAVNMWEIMNTNPYRYISWNWKGVKWRGYVDSIDQNIALRKPTEFILMCHPSVTNQMLIDA